MSRYRSLDAIPAAEGNVRALAGVLTDPDMWGLPEANCVVLIDPATTEVVFDAVEAAIGRATETLIVYFAGHGLVSSSSDLYLALPRAGPDALYRAVSYNRLREVMQASEARIKIVVLDCCFSGRAAEAWMSGGDDAVAGQTAIEGTSVLTACGATQLALAPPGAQFTTFTGTLLETLRQGVPSGPDVLDVNTVYRTVRSELSRRQGPTPRLLTNGQGGSAPLVRNRSAGRSPDDPPPAEASPVPSRAAPGWRRGTAALALSTVLVLAAIAVIVSVATRGDGQSGDLDAQQVTSSPSIAPSAVPPVAGSGPAIAVGEIGAMASTRSGQCVEVLNGSPLEGAKINQFTCNKGPNQQLLTTAPVGSTDVKISFRHSGLCLAGRDDAVVVQLACDRAPLWRFRHRGVARGGDGRDWDLWEVRSTGDGKCLELPGGALVPGTELHLAECTWSPDSQQWRTLSSAVGRPGRTR